MFFTYQPNDEMAKRKDYNHDRFLKKTVFLAILSCGNKDLANSGNGCEQYQILVLQRRPCAWSSYVYDRNSRCEGMYDMI